MLVVLKKTGHDFFSGKQVKKGFFGVIPLWVWNQPTILKDSVERERIAESPPGKKANIFEAV